MIRFIIYLRPFPRPCSPSLTGGAVTRKLATRLRAYVTYLKQYRTQFKFLRQDCIFYVNFRQRRDGVLFPRAPSMGLVASANLLPTHHKKFSSQELSPNTPRRSTKGDRENYYQGSIASIVTALLPITALQCKNRRIAHDIVGAKQFYPFPSWGSLS